MEPTASYSTEDVAPKDRFAFWRDAVCETFVQLGCDTPRARDFTGSLRLARHGAISISQVSGGMHHVERRKRDIRAASDAFVLLSVQTERTSRITQFGTSSLLAPGDMGFYDSTCPYRLDLSEGFAKTVVQLPRDRLLARLPSARMLGGMRIDGQSPIGRLVRENVLAFSAQLSSGDPTLNALLQETLIDLIATGLASGVGSRAELSSPEQQILLRAHAYIAANVGDPDLDRTRVARETGLSVRRLSEVFARDGVTVAEAIRRARFERVRDDLRDPRFAGMTISEIAIRGGFSNLQHFSTLFRKAQGVTPKAWRAGEG